MRRFALLAALIAAGPAWAEPDIEIPDGDHTGKILPPSEGQTNMAYSLVAGLKPLRSHSSDSGPSGAPALGLMEEIAPLASRQGKGGDFWLVGDPKTLKPLGWIERTHAVRSREAQIDPFTIHRKAMLVNTARSLEDVKKMIADKKPYHKVPIYPGLPDSADKGDPQFLNLAQVLFVYSETHPADPNKGEVFVGLKPSFDPRANQAGRAKSMLGWVKKSFVCFWTTRQAVEWNHVNTGTGAWRLRDSDDENLPADSLESRKKPGRVYRTKEAAEQPGKDEDVLFQENFDKNGVSTWRHVKPNRMRFPLLEGNKSSDSRVFKIGAAGAMVDKDGNAIVPADEVDDLRAKLTALLAQVEQTEILFVIDQTESMDKSAPAVADAMQEICEGVLAAGNRRVSLGLAFYSDEETGGTPFRFVSQVEVSRSGAEARAMIKELRNAEKAGAGGDPRELMFDGLENALRAFRFTPNARKMVVLIGDSGSHTKLTKKLRAEKKLGFFEGDDKHADDLGPILEQLVPLAENGKSLLRNPIDFFALQTEDPDKGGKDKQAFRDQCRTIEKLYDQRLALAGVKPDASRHHWEWSNDGKSIRKAVTARYDQMAKEVAALADVISRMESGRTDGLVLPDMPRTPGIATTVIPQAALDLLKREGIDTKFLAENAVQLFYEGYVREDDFDSVLRQVRIKYWLDENELKALCGFLRPLVPNMDGKIDPEVGKPDLESTRDAMVRVLAGDAGDQFAAGRPGQGDSLNAVLAKKGFHSTSNLMDWQVDKLRNLNFTDPARSSPSDLRVLMQIRKKVITLLKISENKPFGFAPPKVWKIGEESIKIYRFEVEKGAPKPNRGYERQGDDRTLWYWIDAVEEFP